MKRDDDLVRQILFKVEEFPVDSADFFDVEIPGYSPEVICEHIRLMKAHGLIDAVNTSTLEETCWNATRLTWEGHDFLESIRNEGIWKKTKAKVMEVGGSVSLALIKEIAIQQGKALLGL